MLKAIPPGDVTVGMFVHALRGGWLSHPFWRGRFLLTNPRDVEAIRASGVSSVIIDVDRSVAAIRTRLRRSGSGGVARRRSLSETLAEDQQVATRIVNECARVMKQVFDGAARGATVDPAQIAEIVETVSHSLDRNRSMLLSVMRLRSKDEYTYYHSVSVCALMIGLAREVGVSEEETRELGIAGLLHDLGKMAVPDEILNKPGRLTAEEFEEIRRHPAYGRDMLLAGKDAPERAIDVCLHHHEKMDGTGYPFGLAGPQISLAARMGAICDVYDALTSMRSYKDAVAPTAAITAMASWQGHFDPELLFAFMKSIRVFPPGMVVRLRTEQLAILRDNGRRASRGRMTVFYDLAEKRLIVPGDRYFADMGNDLTIVEEVDPAQYDLEDWPRLREMLLTDTLPPGVATGSERAA